MCYLYVFPRRNKQWKSFNSNWTGDNNINAAPYVGFLDENMKSFILRITNYGNILMCNLDIAEQSNSSHLRLIVSLL